jgi:ubiquinone/menaquinone biosynthesis C-methylase UbiE
MYKHLQNSIQHFPEPQKFKEEIEQLRCSNDEPAFIVDEIHHLNLGTVQIYSLRTTKRILSDAQEAS